MLVIRTRPINSRSEELDQLLTTYLNVALALEDARAWKDAHCRRYSGSTADLTPELEKLEGDVVSRTNAAIARLEQQLSTIASVLRCVCAEAVRWRMESAATLWAEDIDDAARSLRTDLDDERRQLPGAG